ncbi:hypothetical protein DSECCO2_239770 [anaerobic digester metagenome]
MINIVEGIMKYQKRQEMKKKILAIIALLMACIMVLSLIAPFTIFAAPVATNAKTVGNEDENVVDDTIGTLKTFGKEQFDVELRAGFDGNYVVKKTMPVQGVITNRGDAFHGEVQIKAYTRNVNRDKEYAVYYQKLDLEQGASKAIDMAATMGSIHKYLEISLVDEKGNKVYQDYLFLTAKDPKTVMIGVLNESPQDLKYLSNLHLAQTIEDNQDNQESYQAELNKKYDYHVYLNESTFPGTIEILNSFSVLVVDDFDFSVLTQEQRQALHQWILGGGTMVVGTGAAAQKTLKGLDFLDNIQVKAMTTVPAVEGVEGAIGLAQLSGDGLSVLLGSDGTTYLSVLEKGKGHVILSHFSLSQAPMAGQATTLEMLNVGLGQVASEAFYVDLNDDGYYDNLRYIATDFPPLEMNSILLIFGAIAVYILIVGPVLYFSLKKKDKREKGWILVPAFSFIFMGLVFLLAQGSSYRSGMIHSVSAVEMQEGSHIAKADTGMAIKYASKGSVIFSSDEKIPININMEENHYRDSLSNNEVCAYRILSGNSTEVTFSDSESWGTQYFSTQSSVDLGGNVESTVRMKDGKYVGEIINHTNVDFYRIALMLDGNFHNFESLKAGDTLTVDIKISDLVKENLDLYGGFNNEVVREQVASGEMTRKEAYMLYMEHDLRERYYNYQQNTSLIPVTFYGYSQEPILSGEKKLNGKQVQEDSLTMYKQDFPLELSKQEQFEISLNGIIDSNTKYNENNDEFGSMLYTYEDSDFDITYALPDGVKINQMELQGTTRDYVSLPETLTIFNRKTKEWDEVKLGEKLAVENYIDESNKVEIMMHCLKEEETVLPKLWMQGGGLFVGN